MPAGERYFIVQSRSQHSELLDNMSLTTGRSQYRRMRENESILKGHPGAIVGFIVGVICFVLIVAGTTYTLIRRKRRPYQHARTALKLGGELLLDEPHSFVHSWSGSSGSGERTGPSRHLVTPEKPNNGAESPVDLHSSASPKSDSFVNTTTTVGGLGKLQFTIGYDSAVQELLVSILRCTELPVDENSPGGCIDSFVKLELLPEKRHRVKTRVVRNSTSPFFGEAFTFSQIALSQLRGITLHFIVVGFDKHSRDTVIGEVVCLVSDLHLNISREMTLTKEISKRKFSSTDKNRGSLLVSLCYLPAANRLTVVILKAEGLPKIDIADTAGNPYVKLYFLESDRRIAKKKTHVKKRTSNPVFNEAFAFEIPQRAKLENIKLDLCVVNWDREASSKVIGYVSIGFHGIDVAKRQWKAAIENPRKQVAEWHTILA